MKYKQGTPSPRPWRIERITRHGEALVKAANDEIVAVLHADNANVMVEAVNNSK